MSNQTGLVRIVEFVPRNGDPISGMFHVQLTVVVILAVFSICEEFIMVDPDVGRLVDGDAIVGRDRVGDLKTTDNDVLYAADVETGSSNACAGTSAENSFV